MPRRKPQKRVQGDGNKTDHEPTRKSRRIANKAKTEEQIAVTKMAEENIRLVASPNLITRQRRGASQVTCEDNTVERKRIAKILLDCSDLGKVPCSVYGRNRYKKFPGFFFCSRCKKGDDEEASRPNCYINRKAENGRYTCTAEHSDYWEPTQIDPKSKYQPDPPPSSLFCVPISQRPQFISPIQNKRHQVEKRVLFPSPLFLIIQTYQTFQMMKV